jgi:arsenate reductase-like glutaredoxin family protein
MAITLCGIRNCDSVKKARAWRWCDEVGWLALMLAQPSMIKRPVW